MKSKGSGYSICWSEGGSHTIEIARASAPGPGMAMTPRRWCFRCQTDQPTKGGKVRAGMFVCMGCVPPKERAQ